MELKHVIVDEACGPEQPLKAAPDRYHGARPRMVLAHGDAAYASASGRHFRRLGWEVHLAHAAPEVRRLAAVLVPAVVILDTDFPGESGWLICSKLRAAHPGLKVVLVVPPATPSGADLAAFIGAGLVRQDEGVQALVDEVYGTSLAAAG